MVTIRDIARLAGVSVPTVSRALNDRPVDKEMALRVRNAAKALSYVPNRSARRLRGAGSRLMGAIFSELSNPFYVQVLRTIEEELARAETTLIVANSNAEPEREARLVRILREEGVAGLIIAPADEAPEPLGGLVRAGFPITVIDRTMPFEVDTVRTRNFDAATAAVGHLVGLGHRRIGFIGGPHRLSSARDRHAGFRRGLSEAGLAAAPKDVCFGDYRMESGRRLAATLTDLSDAPTAVLVANNEMVIGALNHIHAAGMTVPDDLAIVGFDDFPWSISLNPPLTAIAQPVDEIARTAARLILDRIANPGRPASIVELPAELVVRASCGTGRELRRLKKTEPTREMKA